MIIGLLCVSPWNFTLNKSLVLFCPAFYSFTPFMHILVLNKGLTIFRVLGQHSPSSPELWFILLADTDSQIYDLHLFNLVNQDAKTFWIFLPTLMIRKKLSPDNEMRKFLYHLIHVPSFKHHKSALSVAQGLEILLCILCHLVICGGHPVLVPLSSIEAEICFINLYKIKS